MGATSSSPPPAPFLSLQTGLAELVEALEQRLSDAGVTILTDQAVTDLARSADGYDMTVAGGRRITADAVILATPAFVTATIVAGLAPDAAACLRAIPHVSTATISLGYAARDLPRPLPGYGYVVPRIEGRPVLASTWTSAKWPHRAPDGRILIRVFVGRAGREIAAAATDEELLAIARAEVRDVLDVTALPALARTFRWPDGMPQYTLGHLDRVAAIERCLRAFPGLLVCGNAYRGVGLPDCIQSGETAAERAVAAAGRRAGTIIR